MTKTMNGHSDVVLGLLTGREDRWQRVRDTLSIWGLASAPFDCWLALRGLGTLALRIERACDNALAVARFLSTSKSVRAVYYPGLPGHPDHDLARRQFGDRFGTIVTFTLPGGLQAARSFMAASGRIPFCPSLGELSTTLSHPESTSHRGLTTQGASRWVLPVARSVCRWESNRPRRSSMRLGRVSMRSGKIWGVPARANGSAFGQSGVRPPVFRVDRDVLVARS